MKLPELNEKQITNQILSYLNSVGYYVWRNNSGVATNQDKYGHTRMWRAGIKGGSDIIGITPNGKFIAIEVKRPSTKNNVSLLQEVFLKEIKDKGGVAVVATSLDDIMHIANTH